MNQCKSMIAVAVIVGLNTLGFSQAYSAETNYNIYNKTAFTLTNMNYTACKSHCDQSNNQEHDVAPIGPQGKYETASNFSDVSIDKRGCEVNSHNCGVITISGDDTSKPGSNAASTNQISMAMVQQKDSARNTAQLIGTDHDSADQPSTEHACAVPTTDTSWSDDDTHYGDTYLYPSLMEGEVKLCVELSTPAMEQSQYQFILSSYTSLETQDKTLYPAIDDQTVISDIYPDESLGNIVFQQGDKGRKCISAPLYFKTKSGTCDAMIHNGQDSGINAAEMVIDVTDPNGDVHETTLKPNSSIIQQSNYVQGLYNLILSNPADQAFSIEPDNAQRADKQPASLCEYGICNDEKLIYSPDK